MLKFEFTKKNLHEGVIVDLDGYYRIAPAFMADGVRVFYKRPYGPQEEEIAFDGQIFTSEKNAETTVNRVLNEWLRIGMITHYTVTNQ